MRWQQGRRSTNVQDMRGRGGGFGGFGGRGMRGGGLPIPIPLPRGRMGMLIMLAIVAFMLFSGGLGSMLGGGGGGGGGGGYTSPSVAPGPSTPGAAPTDQQGDFVSAVLGDTEDVWNAQLAPRGIDYPEPTLVLFDGQVSSACGYQSAAVGPFYCPPDRRVYLDTSFFRDLEQRFGAPGDFAQAYVIAHEVGHHVQNVLGTASQVDARSRQVGRAEANELSVRMELQADCYAGVWGHHAAQRNLLEPGDVEEGLRAAAAIGDDRLQRESQGYVVPESFTHGSSDQRVRWFRTGMTSGQLASCDTFAARSL
jgi:predicted metalloprotease